MGRGIRDVSVSEGFTRAVPRPLHEIGENVEDIEEEATLIAKRTKSV